MTEVFFCIVMMFNSSAKQNGMCLGTFSRRARLPATTFIFARVRILGTWYPRQLPFSVFILLSTVEHDRTDVFPVLVIFLRELVFHLGLHVHPELLGGQHDVGEHDADVEFLKGALFFSGKRECFFRKDIDPVRIDDKAPWLGIE